MVVGGEVTSHRLFVFGGGWIRYRNDAGFDTGDELFISLAGIAVELLIAIASIAFAARARSAAVRVAGFCVAGICLVHVGFYLAAGTHHGFGDGLILHRQLGDLRWLVIGAASLLSMGAAYWWARRLLREVPGLPQKRWRALAALAIAGLVAGVVHGGLAYAERRIADDKTYADIMRADAERQAMALLAAEAHRRRLAGLPMGRDEAIARQRQLTDERAKFPIRPILAVLVALAGIAGSLSRRDAAVAGPPVRFADLKIPALLTTSLIIAVAVLARPFY